ncbi:hypothetical protein IW150_004942, partial [Coemansia sp. RSA 2607]
MPFVIVTIYSARRQLCTRKHTNEAEEQVKQMKSLGHYTVDGPRNVDDEIYAQRVNVKQLYWMAGDRYRNADALVNVLMSTYSNIVLDPNYQVVGVAQLDGF